MDPQLVAELCAGTFIGDVTIVTHEQLYVVWEIQHTLGGYYPDELTYDRHPPFSWRISPSVRGRPWCHISKYDDRAGYNNRIWYWQCDPRDNFELTVHDGADDWESFRFEPAGAGVAIRSMVSGLLVAAEPSGHAVNLIGNRAAAGPWETFTLTRV